MSREIYAKPVRTKQVHPSMRKHWTDNDWVFYLGALILFVLTMFAIYL